MKPNTVVTTYDAKNEILAKYIFETFEQACTFVGNYDLDAGNIRDVAVHQITIQIGGSNVIWIIDTVSHLRPTKLPVILL